MTRITNEVRDKREEARTAPPLKVRAEYQQTSPGEDDEPAENTSCDDG